MTVKSLRWVVVVTCTLAGFILPARAQMRTVGDGTQFLFSPGRSENYGIYSGDIGGGINSIGSQLYTRHNRGAFDTGIGSSTLQTTAATSESRRQVSTVTSPALITGGLSNPNFSSGSTGFNSPALNGFTVAPMGGLGRDIYAGNGLTSDYSRLSGVLSGRPDAGTGLYQDLNAVPTFVRKLGTQGQSRGQSHSHSILPLSIEGAGSVGAEGSILKGVEPQF